MDLKSFSTKDLLEGLKANIRALPIQTDKTSKTMITDRIKEIEEEIISRTEAE